jgi:hypothetical protein
MIFTIRLLAYSVFSWKCWYVQKSTNVTDV